MSGKVRRPRRLVVMLLVLCAATSTGVAAACSTGGKHHQGIRGTVTIGPVNCGALTEGQDCTEPYAARLRIRRASDRHLVREVQADRKGHFKVALRTGHYIVDPVNGHPYPRAHDKRVKVTKGEYKFVRIGYDSGVR